MKKKPIFPDQSGNNTSLIDEKLESIQTSNREKFSVSLEYNSFFAAFFGIIETCFNP